MHSSKKKHKKNWSFTSFSPLAAATSPENRKRRRSDKERRSGERRGWQREDGRWERPLLPENAGKRSGGGRRSREGRRRWKWRCLGKVNRGKERRKLRWLPPPPSALAAAFTAACESDSEGEERAIETERVGGGGSSRMKKNKEEGEFIYILLGKITINYPKVYS